ncbi:MAG TPA: hypothetical protein VIK55_06575 [Paludibacter sp.]
MKTSKIEMVKMILVANWTITRKIKTLVFGFNKFAKYVEDFDKQLFNL